MLEAAWSTGRATTPPPGKGCLPLRCLPLPISPSLHSHFDPLRPPAGCDTGALGVGRIIIARTVWAQVPNITSRTVSCEKAFPEAHALQRVIHLARIELATFSV